MKPVSIIITHYNRRELLINTIKSMVQFQSIHYAEILIVDDASDYPNIVDGIPKMFPGIDIRIVKVSKSEKWWSCPCSTINKGISEAIGDVMILQGAEIVHNGDIISDVLRIKENEYFVYGCLSLKPDETPDIWYQHSAINPRCYNFCTAIRRKDILELGGFDERFGHGVAYGDDDFIRRVRIKGMNVIQIDEPHTLHQFHEPMQTVPNPNTTELHDKELFDFICQNESGYFVKNSYL